MSSKSIKMFRHFSKNNVATNNDTRCFIVQSFEEKSLINHKNQNILSARIVNRITNWFESGKNKLI